MKVDEYPLEKPVQCVVEPSRTPTRTRFQSLREPHLYVQRDWETEKFGFGGYLDWRSAGKQLGYTLEPRRGVGKGPIPAGTYEFERWLSPRLGKTLRLKAVPGFTDILIHVGNKQSETQGCILVGRKHDDTQLIDSRTLVDELYDTFPSGRVTVEGPTAGTSPSTRGVKSQRSASAPGRRKNVPK